MKELIISKKFYVLILLSVLIFLIYYPALISTFAFHNDYSLFIAHKGNIFGFIESNDLVLRGRFVGAILDSLQG